MKAPDSGMPEEAYWNSLFDIPLIMQWLDVPSIRGSIVEIGCGYGTFTVPVAKETHETLYAYDIEPSMIESALDNVHRAMISTVHFVLRDIVEQGTHLESESVGMVLLFNILHFDERRSILEEAARILMPRGVVAILHWRKDIATPRGPAVEVRPDRQVIMDAFAGLDLVAEDDGRILEPYHWGIRLPKKGTL
jgi:SAM-dependent methyltransferase